MVGPAYGAALMTGDGFALAIFLVFMFAALSILAGPLLFGHYLLLAGRNWSYRAYLVFGILTGPGVASNYFRDDGYLVVLFGMLVGGISALALRAMLHRGAEAGDHPAFLSGKLVTRPWLAILAAAAIAGVFASGMQGGGVLMDLNIPLSDKLLGRLVWPTLGLAVALALTLWLAQFCKRWFGDVGNLWLYVAVALVLKLLSVVWILVKFGITTRITELRYLIYTPVPRVFWSLAMAWMLVAIYQTLVQPAEPNVAAG